jgi:peptidoglycan/LPS O-acetylase OafA/YrhL
VGIYRLLLAIAVLLSHLGATVQGRNIGVFAVVSFFILSGYVMTALLDRHYLQFSRIGVFYLDRAMRLFPQFLFYFVLTLLLIAVARPSSPFISDVTLSQVLLNAAMLSLNFFQYFLNCQIVPQAWSLGLESQFYLVIPLIIICNVRAPVFVASLAFFLLAYFGFLNADIWGYRMLPGTLFMFLLGSYIYRAPSKTGLVIAYLVICVMFVGVATHQAWQLPFTFEVLAGLVFGVPLVWGLSKLSFGWLEELAGNLSYGVFLNHFFIIWLFQSLGISGYAWWYPYALIASSIALAGISYVLVERPVIRLRHTLRKRAVSPEPGGKLYLWPRQIKLFMARHKLHEKFPPAIWAVLIGIAAFVFYTGGAIVWPGSTAWLMRGDFSQHFLGWNFFRHTPLLQFPFGASRDYGEALGSSIVYSDSTPLFAFLFKPFAAFLPEPFQYIGIWLAMCVMLQGYFAYKLLSLFSTERLAVLLGTAFFVIAPPLWWRIHLEHEALAAHWLILAALYLYFCEKFRARNWLVLLGAAVLAHAYLLAMVLAIWAANLLQRWLKRQLSLWMVLGNILLAAACLALIMWVTGYFMLHDGLSGTVGFGYLRMSLLSLIDPIGWWSTIMPDTVRSPGEYEGFSYLGSGMLILLPIAILAIFISYRRRSALAWRWATLMPLLLIGAILTLEALSNYIGWGERDLLVYRLPGKLQSLASIFRVSGRMFWPVFYLIYLALFYTCFKLIGRRVLPFLLAGLLVFQLFDGNVAAKNIRAYMQYEHWTSPLQSTFWQQAPNMYHRIALAMPSTDPTGYFPVALLASNHHMSINNGYFARTDMNKLAALQRQTVETVFTGRYDSQTLYVFLRDPISNILWEQARSNAQPADFLGELDGYRMLAPGWRNCGQCQQIRLAATPPVPAAPAAYALGTSIDFHSGGNADLYRAGGWAASEAWGNWTDSNVAALWLEVAEPVTGDLTLDIFGQTFLTPRNPQQTIQVSVNGEPVGDLHYTLDATQGHRSLRIPVELFAKNHGRLLILFSIPAPVAPMQVAAAKDLRRLGLGAISMVIH